jgi:hypothetical protein
MRVARWLSAKCPVNVLVRRALVDHCHQYGGVRTRARARDSRARQRVDPVRTQGPDRAMRRAALVLGWGTYVRTGEGDRWPLVAPA